MFVFETYQDILSFLVLVGLGLLGVPLTTYLKNRLNLEGKYAVVLTGLVAGGVAVLDMVLQGQLNLRELNLQTFPEVWAGVFSVATLYYKLLVSGPPVPPEPIEGPL